MTIKTYPYITDPDKNGNCTLYVHPDCSIRVDTLILKALAVILDARGYGVNLNTYNFNGLVTVKDGDIEVIKGWYQSFGTAQYIADKAVKTRKNTGARAYACIGEYGVYKNEIIDAPDDEDMTDECPKNGTLDAWGIL